ncbi:MAG: UDP-N-acetylglucosamine 2-epimerase (hydrolyzing) [Alphaproteobacteria bacterium]|nr:UDP-N-acetylglucosamine 2-epimerase (hydrolyzing) [Alphaproteobacteria bacterium]
MRKISLITTSRADYGIQSNLIKLLQSDPEIDFSLIVSGTHLSKKHGETYREIENDGVKIAKKINIGMDDENDLFVERVFSNAVMKFSKALREFSPDIAVLLGDRYEMLAAAIACCFNNIPIAHLHGGEATQGATDEFFRHAITKAAHLHFTSCEDYRRRVIQLGEAPERVFNVGSLGVENVLKVSPLSKEELEKSLGINFLEENLLVTFHPVTLEKGDAERQIDELLAALNELPDTMIVFTHPNADAEGDVITRRIQDFVKAKPNRYLFASLGMKRYFSMIRQVDAVVGNSSSGIIEVPSFKKATVNIGSRQAGRIQAASVINCEPEKEDILRAIRKSYDPAFRETLKSVENPYDKKATAENILRILKTCELKDIVRKKFHDIKGAV